MINCGTVVEITPLASLDRNESLEAIDNLKRGDLVFFGSLPAEPGGKMRVTHVGIYLGDNHIIHSSHMVRINSLIPGDDDYYENAHKMIAARRLADTE
jgi:cell wall-associated NlpC family hydrolase